MWSNRADFPIKVLYAFLISAEYKTEIYTRFFVSMLLSISFLYNKHGLRYEKYSNIGGSRPRFEPCNSQKQVIFITALPQITITVQATLEKFLIADHDYYKIQDLPSEADGCTTRQITTFMEPEISLQWL
jgi:hypothetical protein